MFEWSHESHFWVLFLKFLKNGKNFFWRFRHQRVPPDDMFSSNGHDFCSKFKFLAGKLFLTFQKFLSGGSFCHSISPCQINDSYFWANSQSLVMQYLNFYSRGSTILIYEFLSVFGQVANPWWCNIWILAFERDSNSYVHISQYWSLCTYYKIFCQV